MIYIVSHKRVALPKLTGYQPIQVGGAAEDFPGFLRDNTGENISEKNANYCELTALYWVWKNSDDAFKGLAHYRRYFGRHVLSNRPGDILGYDALCDRLRRCDIVAAKPAVYHVNAREQLLMESCSPEHFDALRQVVATRSPDCTAAFDAFFAGNRASQYNMLFCRRELFDAYCSWLFGILFELEQRVDLSGASDYQRRLYGFLGERLQNVWMAWNGLRVSYAPVINTEYSLPESLTYLRRDITNGLRFRLRNGSKEG